MEQQKAMGTQQKTKPDKTGTAQKDTSPSDRRVDPRRLQDNLKKKGPHEK